MSKQIIESAEYEKYKKAPKEADWKELHKNQILGGFGLVGKICEAVLKNFGDKGEKVLRKVFYKHGVNSAKKFLEENPSRKNERGIKIYSDWQWWFMTHSRLDNAGSAADVVEARPGYVHAVRTGCAVNNAWEAAGIKDLKIRDKLCAVATEIDYGVRSVLAPKLKIVKFDCQGKRGKGYPKLPRGEKPGCDFIIAEEKEK
jgi:hypothetical protein